jgi:ubiquinone/menaquinone biosynthesis C-methylase UbiE
MTLVKWGLAAAVLSVAVGTAFYNHFNAFLPWREVAEAERLAELAGVRAGHRVADIGAGSGRFAVEMARKVGREGRVYATELSAKQREAIARRSAGEGFTNVSVVQASSTETNLPTECCDVVFMRNVYHHVAEPNGLARSIRSALRRDARVIVIDFEPGALWLHGERPEEASDRRSGHGVSRADTIAEFRSAGFRLEMDVPQWSGPMWLLAFRVDQ